jgi:hypothetical protein
MGEIRRKKRKRRKGKLDARMRKELIKHLQDGNYRSVACRMAGISPATLERWLADAEDLKQDSQYWDLYHAVHHAEADAEVRHVRNINRHSLDDARLSIEFLQRKHPDRWGKIDRKEISGPKGGPVEVATGVDVFLNRLDQAARRLTNNEDNEE